MTEIANENILLRRLDFTCTFTYIPFLTTFRAPSYEVLFRMSAHIENSAPDNESRCVNGVRFGKT